MCKPSKTGELNDAQAWEIHPAKNFASLGEYTRRVDLCKPGGIHPAR